MYTIITENDESAWADKTGFLYHFPKKYLKHLEPGTNIIYYKGSLKKKAFSKTRLSDYPHYFGIAKIGKTYLDKESSKNDFFATITDFIPFREAVLAKDDSKYLETIPESRKSNYWRDGVRAIDENTYHLIVSKTNLIKVSEQKTAYISDAITENYQDSLESFSEGKKSKRYVTTYERNPKYREQAIAIHGNSCSACGFNFGDFYESYAEGFIHVHHIVPVSEFEVPKEIDPETDLIPLCANCHSVVHRKKDKTLSIVETKNLIADNSNQKT
ncbi:HNH endonuclease [Psychrobacter sp. FBL11]|uniref:HNH endonuclease n=1 Tax=Psychrobacter saeujeotis TaxID=3143436 RepID=A0ABU9XD18_9GAMM|nr:HNH endonuclease [uncultured Psychrobacter sp.]